MVWYVYNFRNLVCLACAHGYTDAQKEDTEELKSSDLNEENDDDFGTSDPSFTGSIIINKKRSMKSSDNRPSKKHRQSANTDSTLSSSSSSHSSHNATRSMELTVPKSPYFATNSYVSVLLIIVMFVQVLNTHTRRLRGVVCETEEEMQCRYMASMHVEQAKRRRLNSFYKKKVSDIVQIFCFIFLF